MWPKAHLGSRKLGVQVGDALLARGQLVARGGQVLLAGWHGQQVAARRSAVGVCVSGGGGTACAHRGQRPPRRSRWVGNCLRSSCRGMKEAL